MNTEAEQDRELTAVLDGLTNDLHLRVARAVFRVTCALPANALRLEAKWEEGRLCELAIVPTNKEAARVELEFLDGDPGGVGFLAGDSACLHVPTDTYGEDLRQPDVFLERLIRAVIDGHFSETIVTRGGVVTKNTFRIEREGAVTFSFDRRNLPATIRRLGREMKEQRTCYKPYVE